MNEPKAPLSVLEYLQLINTYVNHILSNTKLDDPAKLRRYLQVSKLLFTAEKILEKDLIENEEKAGDP
jgi:hypothetical protein